MEPTGETKPARQEKPLRRRLRKLLRLGLVLFGVLLLLVALLPTIITVLPVERWVSSAAGKRLNGTARISGFSIGWFRPISLDRIDIRDAGGEVVFLLEDLRLRGGIWDAILSRRGVTRITVQRLELAAIRRADGTINAAELVPPSQDPPPPPEPTQPLDLRTMVPEFPVPIPSLRIDVHRFAARFTDEATTAPLTLAVEQGALQVRWNGGATPLQMGFTGNLASSTAAESLPLEARGLLQDWTDGRTTTLGRMTADLSIHTAGAAPPAMTLLRASLDGDRATLLAKLGLQDARRIALLLPQGQAVPELRGQLVLYNILDTDQPVQASVATVFETEDVAVLRGEDWVDIDKLRLENQLLLDKESRGPLSVQGKALASWIDASWASDICSNASASLVAWPEKLVALGNRLELLAGPVPIPTGQLSLSLNTEYELPRVDRLRIDGTWTGGTLAGYADAPTSAPIDLSQTAMELSVEGSVDPDGPWQMRWDLRADAASTSGTIAAEQLPPARAEWQAVAAARIQPFHQLASAFLGELPVSTAEGDILWSSIGRVVDGIADTSGTLALERLYVAGPALPYEAFQDSVGASYSVRAPLTPPWQANLLVDWLDVYTSGSLRLAFHPGNDLDVATTATLDLGMIQQDFVDPLFPDLPAYMLGQVTATLGLRATQEFMRMELATGVYTNPGFSLYYADVPLPGSVLDVAIDATIDRTTPVLLVNGTGQLLNLGNMTAASAGFVVRQQPSVIDYATSGTIATDLTALMAFAQPFLEIHEIPYAITTSGAHRLEFDVAGSMEPATEEEEPVRQAVTWSMRSDTSLDYLTVGGDFGEAAITALGDERVYTGAVRMPELEWSVEGHSSLAIAAINAATPTADLSMQSLVVADNLRASSDAGVEYVLAEGNLAAVLASTDAATIGVSDLAASMAVGVSADYTQVNLDGLRVIGRDGFQTTMSLQYEVPTGVLALRGEGSLDGLRNISVTLAGDPPVEVVPYGTGGASMSMRIDHRTAEEGEGDMLQAASGEIAARNLLVGLRHPLVDVGFSTTADLRGDLETRTAAWSVESRLTALAADNPAASAARGTMLRTRGSLEPGGALAVEEATVRAPGFGTTLSATARLDDFAAMAADAMTSDTMAVRARAVLGRPFRIAGSLSQDLSAASRLMTTFDGSGLTTTTLSVTNTPGSLLDIAFRQQAADLGLVMPDLFSLRGLSADLPLRKRLVYTSATPSTASAQGFVLVRDARVTMPTFSAEVSNALVNATQRQTDISARMLSGRFLGGPANISAGVALDAGSPVFNTEFSITGMDAAQLLPGLASRRVARRGITGFGSAGFRLLERPTYQSLMESIVFRAEITSIGSEILREMLRNLDASGSSPGIQATLASLNFGRPSAGVLELRNGLLSSNITIVTAAGTSATLPIFDRTNVLGILGAYLNPEYEPYLEYLRVAGLLLLSTSAEDFLGQLEGRNP